MLDARIAFEPRHVVDVDLGGGLGVVDGDEVDGVADFSEATLTEDVEFVQPNVLGDHHVVLGGGEAFWRHEGAAKMVEWPVCDEDAAGVDGQGVREILEVAGVPDDNGFDVVSARRLDLAVGEPIDVVLGQAEYLAQFPNDRAVLEGAVRAHQCHMGKPPEDVLGHIVAVRPRKIDVEIRRIRAVQVDEPLEIQIQFDGIHIRDA